MCLQTSGNKLQENNVKKKFWKEIMADDQRQEETIQFRG